MISKGLVMIIIGIIGSLISLLLLFIHFFKKASSEIKAGETKINNTALTKDINSTNTMKMKTNAHLKLNDQKMLKNAVGENEKVIQEGSLKEVEETLVLYNYTTDENEDALIGDKKLQQLSFEKIEETVLFLDSEEIEEKAQYSVDLKEGIKTNSIVSTSTQENNAETTEILRTD